MVAKMFSRILASDKEEFVKFELSFQSKQKSQS